MTGHPAGELSGWWAFVAAVAVGLSVFVVEWDRNREYQKPTDEYLREMFRIDRAAPLAISDWSQLFFPLARYVREATPAGPEQATALQKLQEAFEALDGVERLEVVR